MKRARRGSFARSVRIALLVFATLFLPSVASRAVASDQIVANCSNDTELRSDWNAMQSDGDSPRGTLTFNCGTATIVLSGFLANSTNTIIFGIKSGQR
jgi:hypothetical protein